MDSKSPADVARRCLCLELLLQRLGLEIDADDDPKKRDEIRRMWSARLGDLQLEPVLIADERALFERPVGELTEEELDDLHGRATGALVLLWALGRLSTRPSFAMVDELESLVADHGLLGSGSISGANAAVASARLRALEELESAAASYERLRGKAREPSDPEKIVAGIAAHHLAWVLDAAMEFWTPDGSSDA